MAIKKIKALSPDPYINKIKGDTEFARLAHLNNLVDQINSQGGGASYKVYIALLNQSGTNAPVATVLENTLGGTPVWHRSGGGIYGCTLNSAFPANKTFCLVTYGLEEGTNVCPLLGRSNDNQVYLYARQFTTGSGIDFNNSPANDICVEIRVYP